MRGFFRWLTRGVPRGGLTATIVGTVIVYVAEQAILAWIKWDAGAAPDHWTAPLYYRAAPVFFLAAWAIWRSVAINPLANAAYRQWLQTTPWRPGLPLPLGEVRLGTADFVLLGAVVGLTWGTPWAWATPLAMLVPYGAALTLGNFRAGEDRAAFGAVALGLLLPWAALRRDMPWLPLAIGLAAWAITDWGWRRTFWQYPWEDFPRDESSEALNRQAFLGFANGLWPLVHPWFPFDARPRMTLREVMLLATLGAVATAVAVAGCREVLKTAGDELIAGRTAAETVAKAAVSVPLILGMIVAWARIARYCHRCAPPLWPLARLGTGRWIIPSYDRVFVAPLATLLVGATALAALVSLGLPAEIAGAAGAFAALALGCGMGPSLAAWRLTGGYRMMTLPPAAVRARNVRRGAVAGR